MSNKRIKVLYILGSGRSGSTLLANILGSIDGFISVGELYYIWDRGLIENRRCGCGQRFRECDLWPRVLTEFGGLDALNGPYLTKLRQSVVRTRHAAGRLIPLVRHCAEPKEAEFLHVLECLYLAIAKHTRAEVIVDSSKGVAYGYALSQIPSLDVYAVHLIRDARAVSYSWMRTKRQPDLPGNVLLERHGLLMSSMMWLGWNTLSEILWRKYPDRYHQLRYEDFISHPAATISKIADFVGKKIPEHMFSVPGQVNITPSHTVSGNPLRFDSGSTRLRQDDEWKSNMCLTHRWTSLLLTWPKLLRYGYIRRRAGGSK